MIKKYSLLDIEEYVSGFYFSAEEIENVSKEIKENYDVGRIAFAIENELDIFDLDRWEYICRLDAEQDLQGVLNRLGFNYSQDELEEALKDGKLFVELVRNLWDKDYEIMEIEHY